MTAADPEAQTLAAAPQLIANRYELLGMLGAGAMGTVYRVRDRELDEVVALKVLKKGLSAPDLIERFRREVKLARRVTHRNVARTYDIGEHGGDRFLTMEFIEGEMLAARLARQGRLAPSDVIALARDVCAGLTAAHDAGVLHRDLKPENVIVANAGHAVITDFGIARAAAGGGGAATVGIVGTPLYMAPEQVEGASDLDARADLYALGVMLFELLTGTPPWTGDSVISIAAARLLAPPPDARSVLPTLPEPLTSLIRGLMARRRDDRPRSAAAVTTALEGMTAPPMSSPELPARWSQSIPPGAKVVAVLPIGSVPAESDRYLVEGMLEDLVDNLSVVPGLLVRPRAADTTNADVVVDVSFRRVGDGARASFRLIAVKDGFQLWAQRFDRPTMDVASIADDAAAAIAHALTANVAAKKERTHDPEAEDLYQRGRYLVRRGWGEYFAEACQLLERAHQRTPDDARITGMFALATARTYGTPGVPLAVVEKARLLAEQSLELEPRQADARVALAILHLQNQEVDAAVRFLRQALVASPHSFDALDWLGRTMAEVGRPEDGMRYLHRAAALDRGSFGPRFQLARVHSILGDRAAMDHELGPMPTHPGDLALWFILQARDAMWFSDRDRAAKLGELAAGVELPESARVGTEEMVSVVLGSKTVVRDRAYFDRMLPADASRTPRRASFNAQLRAEICGATGDRAGVLDSLRLANGNSLADIVWLDRCPLFDRLREDADFIAIRERIAVRAERVLVALGGLIR